MLLKTFKGRILAVSLGMTIVSVVVFGYGLAGIYYQHMHKCVARSLKFLTNIIIHEYDVSRWEPRMNTIILKNDQIQNVLRGGLIDDFQIEVASKEPMNTKERLYHSTPLPEGGFLSISSSTARINSELVSMIASRWFFFLLGFIFTSGIIYLLIRHLFAPFNQLVNHCLTCDDPENKPDAVSGGIEIEALRDAIATLQQRISGLQKAQHDSMKALTHELKTPLAQLRLRIDIADQKGEWKSDAIASAREEIDTISEKITHILHETERTEKKETIYLKELIEKWIEELKPLWQHRKLEFVLQIPDTSTALLPKMPFERVARILLENALNHTCQGSRIIIRYQQGVLELENRVCIHQSTPLIHSTGVGLEIARTLCEYYGWKLDDIQEETLYRATLTLDA